jgi:hypothetical protein
MIGEALTSRRSLYCYKLHTHAIESHHLDNLLLIIPQYRLVLDQLCVFEYPSSFLIFHLRDVLEGKQLQELRHQVFSLFVDGEVQGEDLRAVVLLEQKLPSDRWEVLPFLDGLEVGMRV